MYFVKNIQDNRSAINYNMAYIKAAYKYTFQLFMDKPIKKSTSRRY